MTPLPNLDLGAGTISFDFDETIDVSMINLAGITIEGNSGANPTVLTGATLPGTDSDMCYYNTYRNPASEYTNS